MNSRLLAALCVVLAAAGPAQGHLAHIVVESRTPAPGPIPAEILRGHYDGTLDPQDRHNRIITDLASAPRDAQGLVHYTATFALSRPLDPRQASGVLFYDVPNRGHAAIAADADGHVRVISGWQGDLPAGAGLQTITVPVANGPGGTPLTGLALARFTNMAPASRSLPITAGLGQPVARPAPVSLDTRHALLLRQTSDDRPGAPVPSGDWAFADCTARAFPGTPDPGQLCLRGGFDPRFAYTLVYRARDPRVLGIGYAAVRDLVSFLRHAGVDDTGAPNPVVGLTRFAVASGTSQSGNFLRSYLNLGFNEDDAGRIVFDGMNPNIAARQLPLNIRFGVPGGAAGVFEPGSEGTLWWTRYDDRRRGEGRHSLLDRCTASGTCPKIVETFGASEFWGLRMSPDLVGTDARADLPLPDNVRRYYFPGVTHGGSSAVGMSLDGDKPWPGAPACTLAMNPNPSNPTLRALQRAMIEWVVDGRAPPPSRYPTLAHGDLVPATASAMGWPQIPGAPTPDGKLNRLPIYDFGPDFSAPDLSGIASLLPPRTRGEVPMRVPRVDADGNETAGIASVQLQVPLGTYLGWNELADGYGKGGGCGFIGGFIPFARTRAERLAAHDPRPSLEERYADHAGFVQRVRAAVAKAVAERWLLPADADAFVAAANASEVLK